MQENNDRKSLFNIDLRISQKAFDKYYNGEFIVTDTWDDGNRGMLGALDLFGNGASSVYYDDIMLK